MFNWTGELSEGAETPETDENKGKEVEGELAWFLQAAAIDKNTSEK